jgi:hypothetical protein
MTAASSPKRVALPILVCLGALHLSAADGYAASSEPLPGVAACTFDALANDPQSAGLAIHDAPRSDAPVLGRLPAIKDADASAYGRDGEIPEIHVIGSKDGWFLVEGAAYQEPNRPKLYAGRGWVDGGLITTHLFRDTLKKAPSNTAADVVYLSGTDPEGFSYSPTASKRGESSAARARGSRSSSGCRGDGAYSAHRCRETEHCAVGPTDPARNSKTGRARDRNSTIPGRRSRPA